MSTIKLFMGAVRWNQMLPLCHRVRAVTWLKHKGPSLRGRGGTSSNKAGCCWAAGENTGHQSARLDVSTGYFTWVFRQRTTIRQVGPRRNGSWGVIALVSVMLCTLFVPNTDIWSQGQKMTFFSFLIRAMLCWILMLCCFVPGTHGNRLGYF